MLVEVGILDWSVDVPATCWTTLVLGLCSVEGGRIDSFPVVPCPGCSTLAVVLAGVAALCCIHPTDCHPLQLQLDLPWASSGSSSVAVVHPSFHPFLRLDFLGPCFAAVPSVARASDLGFVADNAAALSVGSFGPYEIPSAFGQGWRSVTVASSAEASSSLGAVVVATAEVAAAVAVVAADSLELEHPADRTCLAVVQLVAKFAVWIHL